MYKFLNFIKLIIIFFIFAVSNSISYAKTLDESISQGLSHSISLSAASLEWAALSEQLNQSSAGSEITGTLRGSFSESYSGQTGTYSNSHSNNITATLSKSLYDGGVTNNEKLIARLKIKQKSLQIKLMEQSVILDIALIHLKTFLAKKVKDLREKNIQRVTEQVEANKARYSAGAINRTVLAASEARLARAQSQLISARVDLNNAVSEYTSLVGETPGNIILPELPKGLPKDFIEAENRSEKNSMNIALAKLNLSLNKAKYDSLIASVMPKVSTSLSGTISETTKSGSTEGISLSLSLSSPLFYTPATSSKNRELVAGSKALEYDLDETIRKTKLSAKLNMESFNSLLSQISAYEEELAAAKIAAISVQKETEFGAKTILDVLDADIDVVNAEIGLWQSKSDSINSALKLLSSLGELSTEKLGLKPTAPQYKQIEIVAPPLPSPLSILKFGNWEN